MLAYSFRIISLLYLCVIAIVSLGDALLIDVFDSAAEPLVTVSIASNPKAGVAYVAFVVALVR